MGIEVVPANQASCEDLTTVFGGRGAAAECQCQRYRLARGEAFRKFPVEERSWRLREQTGCGGAAPTTTGLIAYVAGEPVGWCAVAPRASHPGLVRNGSMAVWAGRDEDRSDAGVWAVTCVFTRAGFRRQGVASALVAASVGFARDQGAARLEGYPIDAHSAVGTEDHPGLLSMYEAAGFRVIHQPSKRRFVVAVDFDR